MANRANFYVENGEGGSQFHNQVGIRYRHGETVIEVPRLYIIKRPGRLSRSPVLSLHQLECFLLVLTPCKLSDNGNIPASQST